MEPSETDLATRTAALRQTARSNDSVVTAADCRAAGLSRQWAANRVRLGQWQRPYPGVFITHSGPVGWTTSYLAALRYAGTGAALSHRSAAYVLGLAPTRPRVVEIVLPHSRQVAAQRGLEIRRGERQTALAGLLQVVDYPDTVLDLVAASATVDDVVGWLTAAARKRVHPGRVRRAMARRTRLRHRRLVTEILAETAAGVESPMERRYRNDVERRHGLPRSRLQVADAVGGLRIRSDVLYEEYGVRVELDGELAHPGGRTDRDTWRDNAVLVERGERTLRYRWPHVLGGRCATAVQVGTALQQGGWRDSPHGCAPGCPAES